MNIKHLQKKAAAKNYSLHQLDYYLPNTNVLFI